VCGECKVLVNHFSSKYSTCRGYCTSIGRSCTGAWEEVSENCDVLYEATCEQSISSSDAICECAVPLCAPTCSASVWAAAATSAAGSYTCGARITWLLSGAGGALDLSSACGKVANEFPEICGACGPLPTTEPFPPPPPPPLVPPLTPTPSLLLPSTPLAANLYRSVEGVGGWGGTCECPDGQTYAVGDNNDACASLACENGRPSACERRENPLRAGMKVTCTLSPSPSSPLAPPPLTVFPPSPLPPPPTSPPPCGVSTCISSVLATLADGYSCTGRITWLQVQQGQSEAQACQQVGEEYADQCGACAPNGVSQRPPPPSPSPPPPLSTPGAPLRVMSFNTEYTGYPCCGTSRVDRYGAKMREVDAAVVGTQECQDRFLLSRASGYELVPATGAQNPIFFDPSKVSSLESGWMMIPRDNFAQRTITWARFRIAGAPGEGRSDFFFFNTHLPHNHGEATSRNTHARIARMLLEKRDELGAASAPSVVVGDCNPFASNGAQEGSFESNLVSAGFVKLYEAKGNPGHGGLDKIFASRAHWAAANGADRGTGGSDHPAIAVDLTMY